MKITKAKLKQIIQEELSSLSEARRRGDPFSIAKAAQLMPRASHHADGWDAGGTSQIYNPDVKGIPPEEQADPVDADIANIEQIDDMITREFPGEYLEHLETIRRVWKMLKDMQTGAGNEVAMIQQSRQ